MNKFILNILYWISGFITILFFIQVFTDVKLQNSTTDKFIEWNIIRNGNLKRDIFIIGSSRAKHHYNTSIIDSALGTRSINLGIDGAGNIIQNIVWKLYLSNSIKPRVIIQDIDIYTLAKRDIIFDRFQFLPYLDESIVYNNLFKLDKTIFFDRYLPGYKYAGYYEKVFRQEWLRVGNDIDILSYKGFSPINKEGVGSKNIRYESLNKDDLKLGLIELKELADYCRDKEIKLIFVHSPMYHKALNKMYSNIDIINKIQEFTNINGILFIDFSLDKMNKNEGLFYDDIHLNSKGADIFSRRLTTILDSVYSK